MIRLVIWLEVLEDDVFAGFTVALDGEMCISAACSVGMAGSPASAMASAEVATRNGRCEERTG